MNIRLPTQQSDPDVDKLVEFVQATLHASGSIFCWVQSPEEMVFPKIVGVSPYLLNEYFDGMNEYDPLNVLDLLERQSTIVMLEQERRRQPDGHKAIHDRFLERHNIKDEIDFIFWQNDKPAALLAILKQDEDPPFQTNEFQWEAMRQYIEHNLGYHPKVVHERMRGRLSQEFGLTPREVEIIELLQYGASNAKISEACGIGISTVKTHIINILDKLGVENRASAVAFASSL